MSLGDRDGASGYELHLHIGRVVVEAALLDGIGPNRAQCAEQIQNALRRCSAAGPAPKDPLTAGDKVAHAIWAQISAIVQGARRSSPSTRDAGVRLSTLGASHLLSGDNTHGEFRSRPQRAAKEVPHGTRKDVNV
jgi:hypothetical protein